MFVDGANGRQEKNIMVVNGANGGVKSYSVIKQYKMIFKPTTL